ncbi:MAG: HEAT repeat domain-containing protein, partial [Acidobacteriota bacterium]
MTSIRELRDALRSKTGTKVASACKHVAEHPELADELVPAFARLTEQGAKRDPGCHGKLAIARALHELERWEDEVFAAGVRLVQKQPGPCDAAGELRGVCGLAFAHFGRGDAVEVLAELLADPERGARLGAARALGDAGRFEAGALLRFKLLAGDEAPEVVTACLESLLHLDATAVELAIRLLPPHDDR